MFCYSYLKVIYYSKMGVYPNVDFSTSEFEVYFTAFSDKYSKQVCPY